jgi:general secretion pathway protein G
MTRLMRRLPRWQAGFSLVELLVAAAIMGLLATVALPMAELTLRREKERQLRIALRDIRQAIDAYKAAATAGSIALTPGQSGYPPSLADLVIGIQDASSSGGQKQYFLRRLPRDPFYSDSTVAAALTWGKRSFDSSPDAPREGRDVFDLYSTSTDTGLNGVPYNEW